MVELTDDLQQQYSYDAFMLKNDYVGAFVLGLHLQDSWTAVFEICRTPAVLFDFPPTNHSLVASVETDNYEGMCLAVARLKELGHQTIGYLGGLPLSYIFSSASPHFSVLCAPVVYLWTKAFQELLTEPQCAWKPISSDYVTRAAPPSSVATICWPTHCWCIAGKTACLYPAI